MDRLRLFLKSCGIGGDEWDWTVKHAHLTRYDFVGLLSILLHHTGLAPLHDWSRGCHKESRVIHVR